MITGKHFLFAALIAVGLSSYATTYKAAFDTCCDESCGCDKKSKDHCGN